MTDEEPLYRNRARASSFGAVAETYDRTRPSYPAALLDDLVATGARTAIDVGCGTGLLGRGLAARGIAVLGVEPDAQMAAVARTHGCDVEVSSFEDWDEKGRSFDLLVAGQAWHWVDPERGARKAAQVVAPGGLVALAWNSAVMPDDLADALEEVYGRDGPGTARPVVRHRPEGLTEGAIGSSFTATGAFESPELRNYPWTRTYLRDAWTSQLETHSDHNLMEPEARARLIGAVGKIIDQFGGSFEMHYDCHVATAKRRS